MSCELWIPYLFSGIVILICQMLIYKFISKHVASTILGGALIFVIFAFLIKFLAESMVGCVFG